ncbi:MAG: radical SAM protein [Deltaproteobacteria bacterium]|nr:MAG: radical SAM protein [Deltaproteobacteria bacterium]
MLITKGMKKDAWSKIIDIVAQIADKRPVMRFLVKKAEDKLWKDIVEEENDSIRPAQELKHAFVRNLLETTEKHLIRGILSKDVFHRMVKVFARNVFVKDISERDILKGDRKDEVYPSFLVLSPTQLCNLRCPGCYASSAGNTRSSLPYSIVNRIIKEKVDLWHSRFTVISGGEPFLWKMEGKGIIDLAREHDDNFFMVYTNGTPISQDLAWQMADVGNITPAVSVEGFEEKTDLRRGKGVFKRIMEAFQYLREAGVPFGISVQADRDNWDEVTSKEFLSFYFDEQGTFYGLLFQYMPIGRSYTLEQMVTPEQRLEMFKRNVWAVKEGGYNYIDFWNQGVMTDGCLAAGRMGGYFYIDWNGNVMPCVFIPYHQDNILQVYERGGTLNDVLYSSYFKEIRKWQSGYAYGKPALEKDNLILPCPIRDHHEAINAILHNHYRIKPSDEAAKEAIEDKTYHEGLIGYDQLLKELIDPVWQTEYKNTV